MAEEHVRVTERDYRDYNELKKALEIHRDKPILPTEDEESKKLYVEWLEFMVKEMGKVLFPKNPKPQRRLI